MLSRGRAQNRANHKINERDRGGLNNMLANRFIRLSVVYALIGMALGIYMAASGDHGEMPTHAHINLLGYVSMMLYGLFYKFYPHAAEGRLPIAHFWIANVGLIGIAIGIGLFYGGVAEAEPLAAVSSLVAIAGMAVFALVVFKATRTA
jgi:low temperature requirement protein LtrA